MWVPKPGFGNFLGTKNRVSTPVYLVCLASRCSDSQLGCNQRWLSCLAAPCKGDMSPAAVSLAITFLTTICCKCIWVYFSPTWLHILMSERDALTSYSSWCPSDTSWVLNSFCWNRYMSFGGWKVRQSRCCCGQAIVSTLFGGASGLLGLDSILRVVRLWVAYGRMWRVRRQRLWQR